MSTVVPSEIRAARYPGPRSQELLDEMRRYVIYEPWPFVLDPGSGAGMFLGTVDGQTIFDWAGYYGSKLIGHNHPRLQEPDYLAALALAANNKVANPDFLTPQCLEYYRLLYRLAPASLQDSARDHTLEVYAVNSGAEAVENMLKYFLSLHNKKREAQGRRGGGTRRFLYFDQAFHGRTVYALNVTQTLDPIATQDFHGLVASGNIKLPFPAIDADASVAENEARTRRSLDLIETVLTQMADEIVGIIVEPIQGAGGQRVALPWFFAELSALAHRYDVYLGFDEVQTAGGATGRLFGIDHFNLPHAPQAVAVGKKFAVGALFMREPLPDIGVLDSTWGGGLGDMVRFVQEWRVVEDEGLIARAEENGQILADGLRALAGCFPGILGNVRGMGLYQGFSLRRPGDKARLIDLALQRYDLLLLGAGSDSIRTRPSLSVTADEVRHFLEILAKAIAAL